MESITLDAIDLQLLDLLQHDAAQSNQALAERVHVSPPTCLRRVKRLHDVGLIERQVALLQPDRLAAVQSPRRGRRRGAAVLARVAGTGLCAGGAHARYARLLGVVAEAVYRRCECAQCQGVLQHQAGKI